VAEGVAWSPPGVTESQPDDADQEEDHHDDDDHADDPDAAASVHLDLPLCDPVLPR
jgi:hypothetical protein